MSASASASFPVEHPDDAVPPTEPLKTSYIHATSRLPLLATTIGSLLTEAAAADPDHVPLIYPEYNQHLSYREWLQQSDRLAKGFLALGCAKGDRVTIVAFPDKTFPIAVFAATSIGMICHAQAYLFEPRSKHLEMLVNKAKINVMLLFPGINDVNVKALKEILPDLDKCEGRNITSESLPTLHHVVIGDGRVTGLTIESLCTLGESISDQTLREAKDKVTMDDISYAFCTTGSTGSPKTGLITHHSTVNSMKYTYMRNGIGAQHAVVGLMSSAVDDIQIDCVVWAVRDYKIRPKAVVFPSTLWNAYYDQLGLTEEEGWGVDDLLRTIQDYKITHADVYPQFWAKILERPELLKKYDISSLKRGTWTGTYLSENLQKQMSQLIPEFTNGLGLSEVYYVSMTYPRDSNPSHRFGSMGFPIGHTEVKIVDETNENIVPIGTVGEIYVRSFAVLLRYDDEEQTKKAKTPSGWYKTGDMGKMDEQGFIYFMGRKSQTMMYNHYSDKVYPQPIEETAMKHPKVKEAAVVGLPNGAFGDTIILCVILEPGTTLTTDELYDYCKKELLEYYVPDEFYIFDKFIKIGPRHKVDKKQLLEDVKQMKAKTSEAA
ncbi:acyl-CoA synthetase family member 2, mitochondrial isoform X1 [Lingula anatina]|uniref:Acyl-CoA synthetase family member 2, mitochondrial isoform X1 n=2 Tax=Lingula anatina TaxID=7574 RepID=A0A2R2MU29_LINAN|nr:acyl-CoA synthetase family member 2, mitochondrial isoform X1 [Lingula anatina]XP_023933571.1 acyl-CoA synthetase family member 2, mitochondrial isoform X1 [Lingula anatina]XP_023933572.1 acyl-CoA synthetase family member 2, mitochondrial isoform X1 [Lingula anatina]XP_023933573.1 acyl-CoA synthetase family member 2, mitochondrial isoform X1 [Lingula anatina]|eukprot:XP_023933570.1 acyl-CoA synthetase family member 2, mitochondrial isoform X1 [Lingula anatina]